MLTPRFTCTQTAEAVTISVYCPSVRASDVEIHVDDTIFTLHINPYFLRLNFTHALLDDDASSAQYDAGTGYLTVILSKETKGQHFEDLDLLSKLLAPATKEHSDSTPVIEVISSTSTSQPDNDELVARVQSLSLEREEILKAAENDWHLPQDVTDPPPPISLAVEKTYGFLNMHSGYFKHVAYSENEINELGPNAESCPVSERRRVRTKHEDEKWDEEHYMADYADDEYIQELLTWVHPHIMAVDDHQYSQEETQIMLRLPRKEYLATSTQTHNLYLTLLTIMFSYAYESRTTQCDPTPESAWTLCVLTPAFSALDPPPYHSEMSATEISAGAIFSPSELVTTLTASYRRSLAFPLYRSFALCEACRNDVASLLCKGKRAVLRCLLEMKNIIDHHEVYYVYSKIWLDDFCVWIQAYASDEQMFELGDGLKIVRMDKSSIGWGLSDLEAATIVTEERSSDSDDESE